MTDLNQAFKQRIQQNPEDTLTISIYSDWLEEQGSFKAVQVRDYLEGKPVSTDLRAMLEQMEQQTQTLCTCEFAERALPVFEQAYPDDQRPRLAIEAARRGTVPQTVTDDAWAAAMDAWHADQRVEWYAARAAVDAPTVYAAHWAIQALGGDEAEQQLLIASKYLLFY